MVHWGLPFFVIEFKRFDLLSRLRRPKSGQRPPAPHPGLRRSSRMLSSRFHYRAQPAQQHNCNHASNDSDNDKLVLSLRSTGPLITDKLLEYSDSCQVDRRPCDSRIHVHLKISAEELEDGKVRLFQWQRVKDKCYGVWITKLEGQLSNRPETSRRGYIAVEDVFIPQCSGSPAQRKPIELVLFVCG